MNTLSLEYFNEQCENIKDPMHVIENMAAAVMAEYNLKEGELKWQLGDTTCHAKFEHDNDESTIITTVNYQENDGPVTIIRHTFYEGDDPLDRESGYEIHANKMEFGMSDNLFLKSNYCQQLSQLLQR